MTKIIFDLIVNEVVNAPHHGVDTFPVTCGVDAVVRTEDDTVMFLEAKGGHRQIVSGQNHLTPRFLLQTDKRPPRACERLLELIPLKYREHLAGDLEELYKKRLRENGVREAQRWYRMQVGLSFVPIVWAVIKELIGLAMLLKLIK